MFKIEKDDLLNEMAYKIGIVGDYLIYVNSDDAGNIPHFHIVDEGTRGKGKKGFHCCIKIEKAEYFNHGNKQDKLNSNERKELMEFLRSPFRNPKYNGTNWEFIKDTWNDNNSKMNVSEDCKMPDYTKLR